MCSSALYPGNLTFREMIKKDVKYLVDKYPEGYEGWEKQQGENAAGASIPAEA